ncbi:MAG: CidA/LrgA family protein [Lachnoclostridium sp.]|nr:CidA/LrgA family protein [Lachnoclostridium sp.]
MKYLKELAIIFGITMAGEILNELVPLPVPAGVYGLFLLLGLLCAKIVKLEDVATTGNLLLDMMPLMFVPAAVGLIEKYTELTSILIPFIVISAVSTLVVMTVTGKTTEMILHHQKKEEK